MAARITTAHIGRALAKRWCAVCGKILHSGDLGLRKSWSTGGSLQAGSLVYWLCQEHGEDNLTATEACFELYLKPPAPGRGGLRLRKAKAAATLGKSRGITVENEA